MKNPIQEFKRWLQQAEHDLETANILFHENRHSDVCYFCEQTAQKALKAYLYFKGERFLSVHAIKSLLEMSATHEPAFSELLMEGSLLDQYYLGPRYPDAVAPPAVPYEIYSQEQAQKALDICSKIVSRVKELCRFKEEGKQT